jgi:hypothetical protein
VPDAQLLATEIVDKPGDLEGGGLTQDLIDQFQKAILSFLEFDETVENDIICKKMNRQPSPAKECIFIVIFLSLDNPLTKECIFLRISNNH